MWQLIRLTLLRWRRQQQRLVDRVAQVDRCRYVPAQISSHNLIVDGRAIGPDPCSIGLERKIDNAICESKGCGTFIKNEGSVGNIANRNYSPFTGARVGVVCHDGSYRVWEWNAERNEWLSMQLGSE
jgi:hypothetical protein